MLISIIIRKVIIITLNHNSEDHKSSDREALRMTLLVKLFHLRSLNLNTFQKRAAMATNINLQLCHTQSVLLD